MLSIMKLKLLKFQRYHQEDEQSTNRMEEILINDITDNNLVSRIHSNPNTCNFFFPFLNMFLLGFEI